MSLNATSRTINEMSCVRVSEAAKAEIRKRGGEVLSGGELMSSWGVTFPPHTILIEDSPNLRIMRFDDPGFAPGDREGVTFLIWTLTGDHLFLQS